MCVMQHVLNVHFAYCNAKSFTFAQQLLRDIIFASFGCKIDAEIEFLSYLKN